MFLLSMDGYLFMDRYSYRLLVWWDVWWNKIEQKLSTHAVDSASISWVLLQSFQETAHTLLHGLASADVKFHH